MPDITNKYETDNWDSEDDEASTENKKEVNALIKKYTESQVRVVRSSLDLPLQVLKDNIGKKDYINIAPAFQRRGRWDIKKRSLLIESFLLNIPIPPIFLYENTYNQYEVMDGRQRVESIYEFLNNGFALKGLEYWGELNGDRFKDLPDTIQRGLLRRTLNAIVLLTETNNIEDSDIRMILFDRLNTGGIQLNAHELRNAIYPSKFNDLLKNLSRNELFTKLWDIPKKEKDEDVRPSATLANNQLYKTMLDCELVLRFFAIRDVINEKIKGSLRSILDKTMQSRQKFTDEEYSSYEELFLDTLKNLDKIFKGKPYIILPNNEHYSRPLYDAMTVAFSFVIERKKNYNSNDIPGLLEKSLKNEKDYEILTGKGNTVLFIKERFSLAYKIITGEDFK
jgi:hypothetical protein